MPYPLRVRQRAAATAGASVIRFDSPAALARWQPIGDAVMGGISSGRIDHDPQGHAVFSGNVSFANGGGFASVRCPVVEPGREAVTAYELTVRGDGKTYKLNLRIDSGFDGISYQARFAPPPDWTRILLPLAKFLPTWRGRPVPDAPPLYPARLQQIGFLIADRQQGPFRMEIRSIIALP